MPYTIAIALLDGAVTTRSYEPRRFTEPAVVDLMRKVKVTEDAKLTAQYPESSPSRVTITLSSGEVRTCEMRYPTGHVKNAMDDKAIEAKFHDLCGPRIAAGAREELLRRLWNFERVGDIETEILGMLAV
jgi:2-methylcitrate dehydratase